MDREEIETTVRKMYACRLDNNLDECVAHFASNSVFELCGSSEASPIASRCEGDQSALRELLSALIDTWRWKDIKYSAIAIDGDEVFVRYQLTAEFVPLAETVTTEVTDHLTLRDGQILSLSEFVDTAMVSALVARVEAQGG